LPIEELALALRFLLATNPEALTRVLGIVYRTLSAYVLKKARLTRATGATGAVTLIQRFGSALNLNIHFHLLVLDGAYLVETEPPVFRRIAPPTEAGLKTLVGRLAERIGGRKRSARSISRRIVYAVAPLFFGQRSDPDTKPFVTTRDPTDATVRRQHWPI
jgi:Putative transposase